MVTARQYQYWEMLPRHYELPVSGRELRQQYRETYSVPIDPISFCNDLLTLVREGFVVMNLRQQAAGFVRAERKEPEKPKCLDNAVGSGAVL
jgi:hypothetical protein